METNFFNSFTKQYSLSKTLRFELIPQGNFNLENFRESTIFKQDEERATAYPIVKIMLDQYHKRFIEDALCNIDIDWHSLYNILKSNKKENKYVDDLKKEQDKVRKMIVDVYFKQHDSWKYISKDYSKLIKEIIPSFLEKEDFLNELLKKNPTYNKEIFSVAIAKFKNFSVYFGQYFINRGNMYKSDAKSTSIAYRIVHDNFTKFVQNLIVYERLKTNCSVELRNVEESFNGLLDGFNFDKIFNIDFFNKCATQKGIELYNFVIGGKTEKNFSDNIIGINNIGNEYFKHNQTSKIEIKELTMSKLNKQILSERIRPSYIPEKFTNDEQVLKSMEDFYKEIKENKTIEQFERLIKSIIDDNFDLNKIFIVGKSITDLSSNLYGNWDILGTKLRDKYLIGETKKVKQEREKEITEWVEKKAFSIKQIVDVENELQNENSKKVLDFLCSFKNRQGINLIDKCEIGFLIKFKEVVRLVENGNQINSNELLKEEIKEILDNYINIFHFLKLISLNKKAAYLDYNTLFYNKYDELLAELENIIPLYNKVRSYITKKPADEGKMLLKFDSPTLGNVWASDFTTKASILIEHNKNYYLMINGDTLSNEDKLLLKTKSGNMAKQIIIDTQKPDNKNTPRLFIRSKGNNFAPAVRDYNLPIQDIIDIYDNEKFHVKYKKVSESDYYISLHKLIDYFKLGFSKHDSYKHFSFKWKPTKEYKDIAEFYHDVTTSCYSVEFVEINWDILIDFVNNERIFLFQIFNKDFKPKANGTPNMHTLYWKSLFSDENRKDIIFKLNGEAELFYRKQIIKDPFVHKTGDILVNKTFKDGNPISPEIYSEYLQYFYGKIDKNNLSASALQNLENVSTNIAKLDIIKDKRYSLPKLQFHVPITINFKSRTTENFNKYTLDLLRKNIEEINVIGIDRGERNLLYVTVINNKGINLITPKSFNIIETEIYGSYQKKLYNYQEKLLQREGDRDKSRKNWNKIENIKELKQGYLSQVVHEIAHMIVKYKAIVVLEDLNYGFKRGRFSVERQVYQKFEKMLIDKLNYLVFKNKTYSSDYGNILNGLQLTAPFVSFKELGKQSGLLFYVNASYTSKIDPITGFVNLFNMKEAQKDTKDFFRKFNEITYRNGIFQFSFDYRKGFNLVGTDYQNQWIVCSNGYRIVGKKNKASNKFETEKINLNERLENLFNSKNIELDRLSLNKILDIDDKTFFDTLFYLFKLTLQLRNTDKEEDFLISPVKKEGMDFFNSSKKNTLNIKDADANGAYHIALKGLYLLKNNFPMETNGKKEYLSRIKNEDWIKFAQTRFNAE